MTMGTPTAPVLKGQKRLRLLMACFPRGLLGNRGQSLAR